MSNSISTIEELEQLYGESNSVSLLKETAKINITYQALIEASPFFTIASQGPEGLDCSPRGDAPGLVRIIDSQTIAFADRRGNNRLDTLRNIVHNPHVALLFLIPGLDETLRLNGRAKISVDPDLLASFESSGKIPASVVVVQIDTLYFQCARALKRSKLWEPDFFCDPKSLPTAGQLMKSVLPEFEASEYDSELPERQAKTLY